MISQQEDMSLKTSAALQLIEIRKMVQRWTGMKMFQLFLGTSSCDPSCFCQYSSSSSSYEEICLTAHENKQKFGSSPVPNFLDWHCVLIVLIHLGPDSSADGPSCISHLSSSFFFFFLLPDSLMCSSYNSIVGPSLLLADVSAALWSWLYTRLSSFYT